MLLGMLGLSHSFISALIFDKHQLHHQQQRKQSPAAEMTLQAIYEAIIAAKLPREKVIKHNVINREGFGEVYDGIYNGQRVVIRILLPERKHTFRINAFPSEAKLMAMIDHPNIATFIGVAWESITNLCVVTSFDHAKLKVALHVVKTTFVPVNTKRDALFLHKVAICAVQREWAVIDGGA
ncbi:LOW QUALITY PROTEIN: TKL/DRK protein kinase [Phytophthora palmivora]|uniref:TKL/DRK protein kinase n=1 Tax=Phytophthora palmivora TaxID=4796 RepID=A0A2P4XWB7_9STRA|nr:LOW QUALITY PROTEIN: TKL/DRK protein kinase [Phytophthora palmivora]